MIFVRDKGRLCNNILQFGHVYAWAREHGRKALSMRFAYKYPWFRISHTRGHNFLTYVVAKGLAGAGLLPVVSFDTPGVVELELVAQMERKRNLVVQGWEVRFYDLFLKYKREILDLFAFLPEVEKQAENVRSLCRPGDVALGLHIRRGDYARWQGGRYLYSDAQYAAVVRRFAELHADRGVTVFVCGNDPTLDRDFFRRELPDVNFVFAEGNPAEDLCLLSKCDWLAGAPSTFSLVASMYRDVPLYWIKDPAKEFSDSDFDRFDNLFRVII